MKKIILHIGLPKTGSTSLQRWLYDHIQFFHEKGVGYYFPTRQYFPWGHFSNATFILCDILKDMGWPKDEKKKELLEKCPNLDIVRLRINDNMIEDLKKEKERFRQYLKKYDVLILTEETISQYAMFYDDLWVKIKEYLDDVVEEEYETDVVIYLRRQDEWLESSWKENLSNELPFPYTFEETVELYDATGVLNYYSFLDRIAQIFGKEHIVVRNYDRERFLGFTLSNDFILSNPDIMFTEIFKDYPPEMNISRSMETSLALVLINKDIVPLKYRGKYIYTASIAFNKNNSKNKKNQRYLSKDEARTLVEHYQEYNKLVEKEYLNGNQLFSDEFKDRIVVKPDFDRDYKNALLVRNYVDFYIEEDQKKRN